MHWTRQQRRLIYTLGCFFVMSLYFVRLAGLFPITAFLLRIVVLVGLVVLGKICHQEALPWEIPLYFIVLSLLGLLPFQRLFASFAPLALILTLVAVSALYVYLLKPEKLRELFTGNLREVFVAPVSYPRFWYQLMLLFAGLCLLYLGFRLRGRNLGFFLRPEYLTLVFLQAIQVSFACFTIPLIFLKEKQELGDLLIVLAVGFGLFGRYLLMGSYLAILIHVAVGFLLAKATAETKGSLASVFMLLFYLLLGM